MYNIYLLFNIYSYYLFTMRTITIDKSIGIITAFTNCIIYSSSTNARIILSGQNINTPKGFYFDEKILTQKQIDKDKLKYETCVKAGLRERSFIFNCIILNNLEQIKSFYLTNQEKTYDNFDCLIELRSGKKLIIEVKFRNIKSTKYIDDYLMLNKYTDLMNVSNDNKNSEVYYIMVFSDYVYWSYKLKELWLDFEDEGIVQDYVNSNNYKSHKRTFIKKSEGVGRRIKFI